MRSLSTCTVLILTHFFASAQTFVPTYPSRKNVVLEELTGINCPNCPDGHARANAIQSANPGRVILINVHAGSYATPNTGQPNYKTPIGNYINNILDPDGYPSGGVNRFDHDNNNAVATGRGDWAAIANTILPQVSPVNIAAKASIDVSTRALVVDVEAFYTGDGIGANDKLHVFILQNKIVGPQSGASANPSQVLPLNKYLHNNMLRHSLSGTSGTTIDSNTFGSFFQKQYTYILPEQYSDIPLILTDLEIVAFITDDTKNTYTGAYADINFTSSNLQANTDLIEVQSEFEYSTCDNQFSPMLTVFNKSNSPIQNITVDYVLNGTNNGSYTLDNLSTPLGVGFSSFYVPSVPLIAGDNAIEFTISQVNGVANTSLNNSFTFELETPVSYPLGNGQGSVNLVLDQWGSENEWTLTNLTNNVIMESGGPYSDNATGTSQNTPYTLSNDNSCYQFEITDEYGDGMCCSFGNGSYKFRYNNIIIGAGSSFGAKDGALLRIGNPSNIGVPKSGLAPLENNQSYTVMHPTSINSPNKPILNLQIYPNPATEKLTLNFEQASSFNGLYYEVLDQLGRTHITQTPITANIQEVNLQNLSEGLYFLSVGDTKQTKVIKMFTVVK